MSEPDSIAVVLSTLPDDERAVAIARALVDDGVAACVNLVPGVRSIYRWEGAVADDREQLAIIKTRRDRVDALVARLRELHPYQVPEAIVLPVAGGHAAYLAWVAQSVR
ncbi:MAG: divalent-cation tolerance protein CutA [Myxococcales bacterium]|nr:divalent-cation tolerance protein CutA [Myxococcales bacterium]MBK7196624.1 divalent-cation tolerance protein CutA [Myxococcales bacterium]MBP6847267.1 divalent-cation tolerance protein CutA [Kofleriaceae bacterium]